MAALGGLGLAATAGAAFERTAQATRGRRTYVLVHGAWHGGWCWRDVRDALVAEGHRVYCPTLSGLGERSHLLSPAITLDTHIADIENVIRWEQLQDVILVGHSYAGMVITGVADRLADRMAALVYLDAVLPSDGEAMSDIMPFRGISPTSTQLSVPAPPAAVLGVPEDKQAWVDALYTPMPLAATRQPIRLTGAFQTVRKKIYVRAIPTMPAMLNMSKRLEALSSKPDWQVMEVEAGHIMMLDSPEKTAQILSNI